MNTYGYGYNLGGNDINWGGCLWTIAIIAVILFFVFAPLIECQAKTSDIGFARRWGPIMGCQIEVKPGQWIPLESYYFKQE